MTSTSITKIGGVVVVTQVIPQDETSIPLQAPPSTTQAPPPVPRAPSSAPAKMDDMTAAFLRGQPQVLGVVQIFIGVLCILFSLTAAYSQILMVHAPLCLAVTFVVSGSLALAAVRRTSVCLVLASLVWNLISVVVGLGGVAYLCWLLADRPPSERFCDAETVGRFVLTDKEKIECISKMWMMNASVYGPLGLLLVLLVLQVCAAVTVCVFSGKSLRRRDRYTPIVVEVEDGSAASAHDSDVALLGSE
ncbi:membrane-spanning 4-domains subfamily A member 4A [Dicentrarchus labrax]|uniref:membrane-spanning 4-domains subfamily A member 4A n=1 Tax=Dicentrarchus labrax TaxID=13489 RepID=UPI0021F547E7|nr:membrane-spanning 4-domains subfamily A member 4A [Dicentrarchus labrax]